MSYKPTIYRDITEHDLLQLMKKNGIPEERFQFVYDWYCETEDDWTDQEIIDDYKSLNMDLD
jgi:hypothetical protein